MIPPPAPASVPQPNFPVVAFQINLSPDPEQDVSPAPKIYPEFNCNPRVISTAPAKVEVAVVVVASKFPTLNCVPVAMSAVPEEFETIIEFGPKEFVPVPPYCAVIGAPFQVPLATVPKLFT